MGREALEGTIVTGYSDGEDSPRRIALGTVRGPGRRPKSVAFAGKDIQEQACVAHRLAQDRW